MNGLRWCGSKKEPGVDYKECPYECSKQRAFWGLAAAKVSQITKVYFCLLSLLSGAILSDSEDKLA